MLSEDEKAVLLKLIKISAELQILENFTESELDNLATLRVVLERGYRTMKEVNLWKLPLALCLVVCICTAPAHADELFKVEKKHWWSIKKVYFYRLQDGSVLSTVSARKRKHALDVRTYTERHPGRNWTQEFFTRWQSTANTGAGLMITGAQGWQAVRNGRNVQNVRLVK